MENAEYRGAGSTGDRRGRALASERAVAKQGWTVSDEEDYNEAEHERQPWQV